MANSDAPFGLKPAKSPARNVYTNDYPALNTTQILEGDLLELSADGYVDKATTEAGPFIGVAAASDVASPSGSAVRQVAVFDDPDQVFEAQADSAVVAQTNVGERFLAKLDAGNAFLSGHQVDVTAATSATQPLLITGFSSDPSNATGSYSKVMVKILNHSNAS